MNSRAIRTMIADDERLAREKLRILLEAEADVEIIAESCNAQETICKVHANRPDLLFLDIHMPDGDGFDVLREIRGQSMPMVIFSTAYDKYGVKAFEFAAMDYLMKPYDQERLHGALERVKTELLKEEEIRFASQVLKTISSDNAGRGQRTIVIKARGRIVFLDPDEIDWVEAAANYVKIVAGKTSYLFRGQIGRFAERLDPSQFVRIHRSIIVNVQRIKELLPFANGEYIAVLKSGKELSCGKSYRNQLQRLYEGKL
jgi:two-component system, LytTR family, response regulator